MSAPTETDSAVSLRPFRMGFAFGFFNAMTWQVALGTPLVLLAETLGATAFQVGLMYSFLFLMTPVQVLSTALLPRFGYRRLMLFGWGTRAVCLLVPIYLAWISPPEPQTWHIHALIGSIFFFALLRAIGNCAFIPWMYSIIPERARGRYFANEQIFSGTAGVGTLLFCSLTFWKLDLFPAFFWQYLVALSGALLSWYALSKLQDGPKPDPIDLRMVLRESPRLCARPGHYRRFLTMSVAYAAASAPVAAFCAYYLRVEAGLGAALIIVFTMMQYLGAIGGSFVIRGLIDRTGPRRFFTAALLLHAAVGLAWWGILHTGATGTALLLTVYLLLGTAASTWMAANLNYLPRLCSGSDRPLRVSVHGAVTAFMGGVSPIVWGFFLRGSADSPSMNVAAFEMFFLFVIAVQLALLFQVPRLLAVPTDAEPIHLAGALGRPVRSLGFLVNLVGYRPKERKPDKDGP